MGILESGLKNKNIVLCGVGSGQGTATAKLLMKFGAHVFGISRSGKHVEQQSDGTYTALRCNLENLDEIKALMNSAEIKDNKIFRVDKQYGYLGNARSKT
jgi:hypothetical protein